MFQKKIIIQRGSVERTYKSLLRQLASDTKGQFILQIGASIFTCRYQTFDSVKYDTRKVAFPSCNKGRERERSITFYLAKRAAVKENHYMQASRNRPRVHYTVILTKKVL